MDIPTSEVNIKEEVNITCWTTLSLSLKEQPLYHTMNNNQGNSPTTTPVRLQFRRQERVPQSAKMVTPMPEPGKRKRDVQMDMQFVIDSYVDDDQDLLAADLKKCKPTTMENDRIVQSLKEQVKRLEEELGRKQIEMATKEEEANRRLFRCKDSASWSHCQDLQQWQSEKQVLQQQYNALEKECRMLRQKLSGFEFEFERQQFLHLREECDSAQHIHSLQRQVDILERSRGDGKQLSSLIEALERELLKMKDENSQLKARNDQLESEAATANANALVANSLFLGTSLVAAWCQWSG